MGTCMMHDERAFTSVTSPHYIDGPDYEVDWLTTGRQVVQCGCMHSIAVFIHPVLPVFTLHEIIK